MKRAEPQASEGGLAAAPCPAHLFDERGRPKLGVFRGTPVTAAVERWASWLGRLFRQKRWQYTAVAGKDLVAAAAVAHLGYVGLAFVLVWDRRNRRWFESEALTPLALGIRADGPPGESRFTYRGEQGELTMRSSGGERMVQAQFKGNFPSGVEVVQFDWVLPGSAFEPLTCVSELSGGGINVTHKAAGLPVGGVVRLGTEVVTLERGTHVAMLDWSRGFPPRRTAWNWAMAAGRAIGGTPLGLNLCFGYNDAVETENVVWLDGQLHRLGPVRFSIPEGESAAPWTITSAAGDVDLTFEPETGRSADENFILVQSRYRQRIGTFTGRILGPRGVPIDLDGLPGVTEDHRALW